MPNNIFPRLQGPAAVSDIYDKVAQISSDLDALKTAAATPAETTINTTTVTNISKATGQASQPQYAFIPNLTAVPSNNPTQGAPYAQDGLLIQVGRNFYVYVGTPTYQWIPIGVTESAVANCEWLTGVAGTNTVTAATAQTYTSLANGFLARFIPAHSNTTAVTLNVNGIGAKAITKFGSTALSGGELILGTAYLLLYDGTEWQLLGAFAVTESAIAAAEWALSVAGTNTITCTTATSYTALGSGFILRFIPANTNNGATTLNVNGIGAGPVTKYGATALSGGELVAGTAYELMWDGAQWQILGLVAVTEAGVAAAEWAVGVTGTNTVTCTTATGYGSFGNGFILRFVPANTNSGAVTIAVNGITAAAVTKNGTTALTGGELVAGTAYELMWDGARLQIVGQIGGGSSSGSFTPLLNFGGASVGVVYAVNSGTYYTDAGGMIHATLEISLTAKGSSTGAATISGLPVTAGGVQWEAAIEAIGMSGLTGALSANVQAATAIVRINQWGATGTAALVETFFTNTSSLHLSFMYHG